MQIPATWRDPSGWRPTPLQMSVPPETVGIPCDKWMYQRVLATPDQVRVWLRMLEAKKKLAETRTAEKKKR